MLYMACCNWWKIQEFDLMSESSTFTSNCFRFFAFLYTICMSVDWMYFLVLSNQLSCILIICFKGGFLWLKVVMSLILFSAVHWVGSNNSDHVLFQALLNAFSKILSGYPLFSRELTIDNTSVLKSPSLLHTLLGLIKSPYGIASFWLSGCHDL